MGKIGVLLIKIWLQKISTAFKYWSLYLIFVSNLWADCLCPEVGPTDPAGTVLYRAVGSCRGMGSDDQILFVEGFGIRHQYCEIRLSVAVSVQLKGSIAKPCLSGSG